MDKNAITKIILRIAPLPVNVESVIASLHQHTCDWVEVATRHDQAVVVYAQYLDDDMYQLRIRRVYKFLGLPVRQLESIISDEHAAHYALDELYFS